MVSNMKIILLHFKANAIVNKLAKIKKESHKKEILLSLIKSCVQLDLFPNGVYDEDLSFYRFVLENN